MSNATDSDDDFTLDRPVVLGPVIAMASLLVILLGIAVLLFARNRRARVTRLRERVELAESRVNALLKIQQMAEARRGVNKPPGSDNINKEKYDNHESIRDNDTTPSVNTQCTQQTKLSQSIDQPLTNVSDHTVTECDDGVHGNVEKFGTHLKMNGHSVLGSSSESLDDASHVAVVNQSLYNSNTYRGYIRGEMRIMENTDRKRSHNLLDVLDVDRGYSSTQVDRWV